MLSNELFRLVSLRRSKPDAATTAAHETVPADPRLTHSARISDQSRVTVSNQASQLALLRARHSELAGTVRDLEVVQRNVVKAAMFEAQDLAVPTGDAPAERPGPVRRSRRRTAHSPERPSAARAILIDDKVAAVIERTLSERQIRLFREARGETAERRNLDDLLSSLAVSALLEEANRLCDRIYAIEESTAGAPTASASPDDEPAPIVSAVGWGDLIVARETLVGYAAREIAHIENVLPGESKIREHQRVSKTEQVEEVEVVSERESEKDSQTTDRYELQAEAQETIKRDFSLSAGVNTSGRYGVTKVDSSLDTAFSQSQSQSRSTSIETAREIINKSLERTFERVRTLRRLTLTEEIKEFNRHELVNQGTPPLSSISGTYLWLEKIQRIELRHYGTRMMVEFHIPEPAISLLESAAASSNKRRLPPFTLGPADIDAPNYLCLAKRYGALNVVPPPPLFMQVGYGWVSAVNEEAENWGEDQFTDTISIPDGYRPEWARVAWSGLQGKLENREFNFAFAVGGVSEPPEDKEHTVPTFNGVVLQLPPQTTWPQGVPVSGRVRGSWDGAMYVQVTLTCQRTAEGFDRWRLATWAAMRAGYDSMVRQLAQEEERLGFQSGQLEPTWREGPAEVNRATEREELQKWCIKSLRRVPQNLNSIEQVGDFQEVNPFHADVEAPIVRFYEGAFEWEHMNYFLYPYHWARRATWRARREASAMDYRYRAFLRAGAARVVVPVTPGFEEKVAWFLDPANPAANELERILEHRPDDQPESNDAFRNLWIELLMEHQPETARGSGTLQVTAGSTEVKINTQANAETQWHAKQERDVGRELFMDGASYKISAVTDESTFSLDRPYEGASTANAAYVAGTTPFGPPWTVNVPTSLVVLADNVAKIQNLP